MIASWINEAVKLIEDLANGKVKIEDARKHAQEMQARKPEGLTDVLLGEMDARIAELEQE